jgi:hypothetical protein
MKRQESCEEEETDDHHIKKKKAVRKRRGMINMFKRSYWAPTQIWGSNLATSLCG